MLIASGTLPADALAGEVAIVTGAGRGIGLEAARALIWLGARVILAEIDQENGKDAERRLAQEFSPEAVRFVQTDVGDEQSVSRLKSAALDAFGRVDVVINNATITPMGPVQDVPIDRWDASYRVNLRGPVLLAQAFLPGMLERDSGVFVCVSSVGEAYMGAYETFKAAQSHLARTLDAECEGTGVVAFTIGPGLVRTPGAEAGIAALAPLYDKTVEEFYAMSEEHIISAEAAGAGFAAAVALADRFRGQEIGSVQALRAAGIPLPSEAEREAVALSRQAFEMARSLCDQVRTTLAEQSAGWQERPFFERQWVARDFKRQTGKPVDWWLESLEQLEDALAAQDGAAVAETQVPLPKLVGYYEHLQELAASYEKDPARREENVRIIRGWQETVEQLNDLLSPVSG
ncbi:MAG: SDR family oxidoreductase [Anaerolineae bacterium]|jgi:NAD(P)-dependent dehydrogenase (short-subunit alcohol dehydrogenase family)